MKRIGIFCGAAKGHKPEFEKLARDLGVFCASQNWHIVYGGGSCGLMGVLADGALAHGGHVTGVMPEHLKIRESAHTHLTEMIFTKDMHTRQKVMTDLSDGFIILPGGLGTLAEFFEVLTWKQIGIHNKPIVLLNADGFWDTLEDTIRTIKTCGFLHKPQEQLFQSATTLNALPGFLKKTSV